MDDIDVTINKLTDEVFINYTSALPPSNDTHMMVKAGVKAGLQYAYDDSVSKVNGLYNKLLELQTASKNN